MAPGPGKSGPPSIMPPVPLMQNTEASVALAGTFVRSCPAGEPFSLIWRQAVLPKQPAWIPPSWPVQNRPTELVVLAGPVVSGERVTKIGPTCPPSQQAPPPAVQGQLQRGRQRTPAGQFASIVHSVVPKSLQTLATQWEPGVRQSSVGSAHALVKSSEQTGPQQPLLPVCPPGHGLVWVPTPPVGQSRV